VVLPSRRREREEPADLRPESVRRIRDGGELHREPLESRRLRVRLRLGTADPVPRRAPERESLHLRLPVDDTVPRHARAPGGGTRGSGPQSSPAHRPRVRGEFVAGGPAIAAGSRAGTRPDPERRLPRRRDRAVPRSLAGRSRGRVGDGPAGPGALGGAHGEPGNRAVVLARRLGTEPGARRAAARGAAAVPHRPASPFRGTPRPIRCAPARSAASPWTRAFHARESPCVRATARPRTERRETP
jgi:hypothetical protein